ncbi:transcriptional regulator, GntR family [Paenibacillus curdlanolyticus YK9]|uniref:Transcriptional regulator, GntR family n=1 Tax=Paenibacillus curdlanolyticus YK9 TaxID=717606 RepID=E0IDK8_9BACL|nr:GntR family transcriptional regulator [Paenibacillus curdlanolyticus]EFM09663.1 transcriptional regulator, GntR family [Paenibacillus curdlanolyticus YK9]
MSDLPLVDVAYQSIRQQLLDGAYLPGDLCSEADLAAKLGMSRTPIRAAISLLEKEGFVQTLYKRGILVKGIDIKDLYDIFDLLCALYSFALERMDDESYELDLNTLRHHYDQMVLASEEQRYRAYYENGLMFMHTMLAAVQNRYVLETFNLYKDKLLFYVVTYRLTKGSNRPYTGRKLYEDIYNKLVEGSYQEAKTIIMQYTRNIREDLLRNGYSS